MVQVLIKQLKTMNKIPKSIVFCGGGTGGHIFPAVAIANEFRSRFPETKILFIGALGKMEMEKIPQEGFEIVGLPVMGLNRKSKLSNVQVVIKAIYSYFKAIGILLKAKPEAVIGTGGYASLPVSLAAITVRIPVFAWEGNAFAGLSNKLIRNWARLFFCGFGGMDKHFPKGNWIHSGNPVRLEIKEKVDKVIASNHFKLDPTKPIIFVTGGSLGAKSINDAIANGIDKLHDSGIQVIWQTGANYEIPKSIPTSVWVSPFLREMNLAYSCADIIISRSGALSVAEIMVTGVPVIFVPSSNVTDDHQSINAEMTTEQGGGILIPDDEAKEMLINQAIDLIHDTSKRESMKAALAVLARPNATVQITDEIIKRL